MVGEDVGDAFSVALYKRLEDAPKRRALQYCRWREKAEILRTSHCWWTLQALCDRNTADGGLTLPLRQSAQSSAPSSHNTHTRSPDATLSLCFLNSRKGHSRPLRSPNRLHWRTRQQPWAVTGGFWKVKGDSSSFSLEPGLTAGDSPLWLLKSYTTSWPFLSIVSFTSIS
jgi:hypothetical protein